MADLTARRDSLLDYLPGDWQQAINTSPVVNALSRMFNKPTPDLEGAARRQYGPQDALGPIADKEWLERQAAGPSWLERNPSAADGVNKLGLLANFLGPGVKLPAVAPKPTGIRAYHGSPHDFDRFDMSKIGTGEGAQVYGRGLYFAESEGVAKSYRDDLGGYDFGVKVPRRVVNGVDISYDVEQALAQANGNPMRARQIIEQNKQHFSGTGSDAVFDEALKLFDDIAPTLAPKPRGRMYEVNIKADPEQFLDWDKPLAQQTNLADRLASLTAARNAELRRDWEEKIKALGQSGAYSGRLAALTIKRSGPPITDTVEELIRPGNGTTIAADMANRLRDAGIPGIKYLDQGSRAAGQGSRNFVVFDENLIEILRKYGLLPPVAAGTAAALNEQEPQQ